MPISEKLKRRFCKDNNLSINILKNPYFESRLELLGYKETYEKFLTLFHKVFHDDEEAYFEYYNSLKDKIIDYIKNSEAYKHLNSTDMNQFACTFNIKQSDVYKMPNIGHNFISIDMKKANFSSLVYYGNVYHCPFFESFDWNEFMSKFTDIDYFYQSKYIRQVVFGNCNPKRQVTFEKYLMANYVLKGLLDNEIITLDDVYSMCSDEIIINIDNFSTTTITKIHDFVKNVSSTYIPLRTTQFTLGKIVGSKAYIKDIHNENSVPVSNIELKCVDPLEAPFVYRLVKDEVLQDEDLYFMVDDKLAKLCEHLNLSISYKPQM